MSEKVLTVAVLQFGHTWFGTCTDPSYLESNLDYVKYLVLETEKDIDFKGRYISTSA